MTNTTTKENEIVPSIPVLDSVKFEALFASLTSQERAQVRQLMVSLHQKSAT